METGNMRTCEHCKVPYDWRRSASSSLKMTYCGSMCEKASLGFTIEALLAATDPSTNSWKHLIAA